MNMADEMIIDNGDPDDSTANETGENTDNTDGIPVEKEIKSVSDLEAIKEQLADLQKELEDQRSALSTKEGDYKALQEIKQNKERAKIEKMVLDYEREHNGFTEAAKRYQDDLKAKIVDIESKQTAETAKQLEKVKVKLSTVKQDIDEKKTTYEQLYQESKQLERDLIDAEVEHIKQYLTFEQTKDENEKRRDRVAAKLEAVNEGVKKLKAESKEYSLETHSKVLAFQKMIEEAKSQLVEPSALQKQLEDESKALAAAEQKRLETELNKAEKDAALKKAETAWNEAEENRNDSIENYIKLMASEE
jgi:chromosome segregation ATPase